MYRKRAKAPVVSNPVAPKAVAKPSVSLDSPSTFNVTNDKSSSRRSPSPDDLFEDSPDEIMEDDEEPQPKKNRLSLSMIIPSQRTSSQMTQSRSDTFDTSKNNSAIGKELEVKETKKKQQKKESKENYPLKENKINKDKSKLKEPELNRGKDTNLKTTQSKPPQSQSNVSKLTSQSSSSKPSQSKLTSQPVSKLPSERREVQVDNDDINDVFDMLSSPPQKQKTSNVKKLTQSKKTSRILSYMEDVVCNAGMTLCDESQQLNVLNRNQNLFIKDVTKSLTHDKRRRDSKQCVDNLMEDLEKYCSDTSRFKVALLPSQCDAEWGGSGVETQDSLIRLLLSVDLLQSRILDFLIDKLNQFTTTNCCWDDPGDNEMTWTQLIINQLRYLNKINSFETATAKLFRVVHSTNITDVKHEIIKFLPDIIGDDQRKEVVDELITVMQSDRSLSASALMSLQNLCLNEDELVRLRHGVIESLRRAPLEHVPAFVWFLLSTATPSTNDELINGLRSELGIFCREMGCSQATQPYQGSKLSCAQLLVFEKLRDSLLMSRKLADAWLKNITKMNKHDQHKPLDVIMLLILYSISPDLLRKRSVETVMKNKIKAGILKENLITETFDILIEIMKHLFNDLLKISGNLLLSPDITVSQFGAFMYTECFVRVEGALRRTVVTDLLDLARVSKGSPALSLLHSLTTSHTDKIAPFITLIMLLLDSVSELSIPETRMLMSVLCLVAFGPDDSTLDTSSLQDVIYMLVQKQLACPDISVFRSGVVCTAMAIKYMVEVPEGMSNMTPEIPDSGDEDTIVLSGKARKAFNLLELVLLGTRSNSDAQVLAHDQLSYIIMNSDNMDKCFIKKVSSLMQGNLQHHFIIASSDYRPKKDGLDARLQYCLDEDIEDPVAVCMSEAVVRNSNENQSIVSCSCLSALVRVVRSLERADLSEIDALLGCALVLPDPEIYSKFFSVEPFIQRLALDCLFHTANWFREIINSFVCFIKEGKPEKIVKRLRLVIHIQTQIMSCLPHAVNYHPPICYFSAGSIKTTVEKVKKAGGSSRRGKSKKTQQQDGDETVVQGDDDGGDSESEEQQTEIAPASFASIRHHFRELDFDTAVLFTLPFVTSPKPIKDGVCSDEFGPKELMFMLDDFCLKLRHVLSTKRPAGFGKSSSDVGFDNLSTIPIDHIIKTVSKLSSHFARFLQEIVEYSHNLISVHDGMWDAAGMFGPGTAEMKQCFCLILSIFNIYFSWQSIRNEAYSKFLTNALMKLGSVSKESAKSLNAVLQYCVTYLKDISTCVMDLSSAVILVTLITTLMSYQEPDDELVQLDIGSICSDFLKRRWYDGKGVEVKGADVSRQVASILDVYLSGPDALAKVSEIIDWLTEETNALDTEPSLKTFPHFNKTNLSVLIGCLCRGLGTKQSLEGKEYRDQLSVWAVTMTCLQGLTLILKAQDTKLNLRQFLKGCLPVLKLFLSQGINVCSCMFKMESQLVSQILKKLQVVTRYIQTVCNYSKVSKDGGMIQQLPVMRGCLESIVLAVKNMVLQNECTDAFFMGAMRNKGLKGEIIASQEEEDEETVDEGTSEVTTESRGVTESQPGDNDNEESNSDDNDGELSDAC